jgi:ferritin
MYSQEIRTDDLIPKTKLKKNSTPKEVFEHILECEEKVKDFYTTIRDLLISADQQELFSSLVTFKVGQIIEIKDYMESYDSFI